MSMAYDEFRKKILGEDEDEELKYVRLTQKYVKEKMKIWNSDLKKEMTRAKEKVAGEAIYASGNVHASGEPYDVSMTGFMVRKRVTAAGMSRAIEENRMAEIEARKRIAALKAQENMETKTEENKEP